jgi:hypothetical protein
MTYEGSLSNPFTVTDTNNVLKSATYKITDIDDHTQKFDFILKFEKPLDASGIAIRAFDTYNAASLFTISNALKITTTQEADDSSSPPTTTPVIPTQDKSTRDTSSNTNNNKVEATPITSSDEAPSTEYLNTVRQWVGYESITATDKDILESLDILDSNDDNSPSPNIDLPDWIKKYVGKWAITGYINYDEFVDVISYVYEKTNTI